MLGIRYLKTPATTYVMHFRGGKVIREGAGLSLVYFAPTSVIVQVPISSVDVPFVFNESSADFQEMTVQGSLTFRVAEPRKLVNLLDYSVHRSGTYLTDDPHKLTERLVQAAQVRTRSFVQARPLRELLTASDGLEQAVLAGLRGSETLARHGLEILDLNVLAVRPSPEVSKALQADTREDLLRRADEALYARRNAGVEMERSIKENELQTELAVGAKRRQIRESQMSADVAVEQQRSVLVDAQADNERKQAEVRAASLRATLEPLKEVDWRTLIAAGGADARLLVSMAFDQLAQNAQRIGELNISPDLLTSLLRPREERESRAG